MYIYNKNHHRFTTALKNFIFIIKIDLQDPSFYVLLKITKAQMYKEIKFIYIYTQKYKQKKKRSAQNMKNIIIYIIMIAVFAFIINHYFIRRKV